ncbi:ABC transporter ATP-binding protein [Enterococcus olivae]
MSKIRIENLTVVYEENGIKHAALENINLTVQTGEFVCILGSSGCGKSTLLSTLEGLLPASNGKAFLDNQPIKGPGIDRAVVFQHYSLFPWLTAKRNVIFGINQSQKHKKRHEKEAIAEKYLRKVGLQEAKDKYPAQLSGGMQQRVAIARAMAMDAPILLMDEPLGAIDPKHREEIQQLVAQLSKEEQKTVVFVTHDIDEAILLADRIIFMEPRHIKKEITINLERPRVREKLMLTNEYHQLRKEISYLFYEKNDKPTKGRDFFETTFD